ncbi:hypothetical protein SC1083_2113 [Aggregatibacter actinomycetemcomitans serotype e str. SC1083]|uniref:Uncharacterized protein n=1 Tax=Aggregatibacter actinomycetemcomitans serotype e str. SC1083 TaxID=907488 RepID=G4AB78_AGGAC|nr:hypothetical protein SC1083_2113 [Aggregatibacter actinomycetemcomitans serotype e str. SC1083]EKX99045.1 hypothetical protein HMPREF9996_00165 [Aggregatibacter actinomycetemcomitans Y4]
MQFKNTVKNDRTLHEVRSKFTAFFILIHHTQTNLNRWFACDPSNIRKVL